MDKKITGLIAAPFTAMNEDSSVDLDFIKTQSDFLHRNGVVGAFVGGTTGEGLSLTVTERIQAIDTWVEVAPEPMIIIAHVGHDSIIEAKALAKHAQEIGVDAVGMAPPAFYKPSGVEQMVDWCAEIAAAAPETPFYYYHIPSMNGVEISFVDLLQAAGKRIPNLAGAKFTHYDLAEFAACVDLDGGRFDMLFGRDEMLTAGLTAGAKGAIGSTYNFAAPLYNAIVEAFDRGDLAEARTLQLKSIHMINAIVRTECGFIPAAKSIMRMLGIDHGTVRLPMRQITDQEYEALKNRLEEIGFFEFCCKFH